MRDALTRNIQLYRWSRFLRNLLFWQAVWFLYFQKTLSASEAILLYAIYDVATTALEVPSGYMSDRLGRRKTLIASAIVAFLGVVLLAVGGSFWAFAAAQVLIGAGGAFASGTDEAMLYESLAASGRDDEIEAQEVIAWRYSYIALALSAVSGGAMFLFSPVLPFVIGAIATFALLIIVWRMVEPPRAQDTKDSSEVLRLAGLGHSFKDPVLLWFFVLGVAMYGFSHLPFVFGQPFILEALDTLGLAASAPLVSGTITTLMMALSVAVSLVAVQARVALGLPVLLLGAFALQIAISGVMTLSDSWIIIAFLMLRMVPDALSRPFILGRIQPSLSDETRATWLSLQSFAGRLVFASALAMGAISTTDVGTMPYTDIRVILAVAVCVGLAVLASLALAARRIAVDLPKT